MEAIAIRLEAIASRLPWLPLSLSLLRCVFVSSIGHRRRMLYDCYPVGMAYHASSNSDALES